MSLPPPNKKYIWADKEKRLYILKAKLQLPSPVFISLPTSSKRTLPRGQVEALALHCDLFEKTQRSLPRVSPATPRCYNKTTQLESLFSVSISRLEWLLEILFGWLLTFVSTSPQQSMLLRAAGHVPPPKWCTLSSTICTTSPQQSMLLRAGRHVPLPKWCGLSSTICTTSPQQSMMLRVGRHVPVTKTYFDMSNKERN